MQSCSVAAGCTSELPLQVQPWHACAFKSSAAAKQSNMASVIVSAFICPRMSRLPLSLKLRKQREPRRLSSSVAATDARAVMGGASCHHRATVDTDHVDAALTPEHARISASNGKEA